MNESKRDQGVRAVESRETEPAIRGSDRPFPVPEAILADPDKLRQLASRTVDRVLDAGNAQWVGVCIEDHWQYLAEDGKLAPEEIPGLFADLADDVDLSPYRTTKAYLLDHVERLCRHLDKFGMDRRLVVPRLIDVLCQFDGLRLKLFWEGRLNIDHEEAMRLCVEVDVERRRKDQGNDKNVDAEPEVAVKSDVDKAYTEKRIRLIDEAYEGIGPLRIADLELVHAFISRCDVLEPDEDDSSSEIARSVAAEITGKKRGAA